MLLFILTALIFIAVLVAAGAGYAIGARQGEDDVRRELYPQMTTYIMNIKCLIDENHKLRMEIKKIREEQTYDKYLRSTTKDADQGKEE